MDTSAHFPTLPAGDDHLIAHLRDLTPTEAVPPAVRAAHLEVMLAEFARPVVAPKRRVWRRRAAGLAGLTSIKLLLAGSVAVAATGGMAATGSLPAPVQRVAQDIGEAVGFDVPGPPGQAKKVDGDDSTTGRDYAPGQLKKADGDDTTTGRDYAPGQNRERPGNSGDAPGQDPERTRGNSAEAPGHDPERTRGNSAVAPGSGRG